MPADYALLTYRTYRIRTYALTTIISRGMSAQSYVVTVMALKGRYIILQTVVSEKEMLQDFSPVFWNTGQNTHLRAIQFFILTIKHQMKNAFSKIRKPV